jgi:hypothetical protein
VNTNSVQSLPEGETGENTSQFTFCGSFMLMPRLKKDSRKRNLKSNIPHEGKCKKY